MNYDFVIIGGGIYGCYAAQQLIKYGKTICLIEKEQKLFSRASYVNQARVHNGYHYPRSEETAKLSAKYYQRFIDDYNFSIKRYKSIYAISKNNSYTNATQFIQFCKTINVPYKEINKDLYFKEGLIEKAYITEEVCFDAKKIEYYYIDKFKKNNQIDMKFNCYITDVKIVNSMYYLVLSNGQEIKTKAVINATYANINQVNNQFDIELLPIKYELCEIVIGKASKKLNGMGVTVMDGPFFSTIPFSNNNYSLTSVCFTPHEECKNNFPDFSCCKIKQCYNFLCNCNDCIYKPKSSKNIMLKLMSDYMLDDYNIMPEECIFAVKPILLNAEKDDARYTIIKKARSNPTYIYCFSGKVNTIYELDKILYNEVNNNG